MAANLSHLNKRRLLPDLSPSPPSDAPCLIGHLVLIYPSVDRLNMYASGAEHRDGFIIPSPVVRFFVENHKPGELVHSLMRFTVCLSGLPADSLTN